MIAGLAFWRDRKVGCLKKKKERKMWRLHENSKDKMWIIIEYNTCWFHQLLMCCLRDTPWARVNFRQWIHNKPTTTLKPRPSIFQLQLFSIAILIGSIIHGSQRWGATGSGKFWWWISAFCFPPEFGAQKVCTRQHATCGSMGVSFSHSSSWYSQIIRDFIQCQL